MKNYLKYTSLSITKLHDRIKKRKDCETFNLIGSKRKFFNFVIMYDAIIGWEKSSCVFHPFVHTLEIFILFIDLVEKYDKTLRPINMVQAMETRRETTELITTQCSDNYNYLKNNFAMGKGWSDSEISDFFKV